MGNRGGHVPQLPSRIVERLRDLRRHLLALEYALESFGEFNAEESFVAAARSSDPAELTRALAVERAFEILVNYVSELAVEGLKLSGDRRAHEAPDAVRDIRRLQASGVLPNRLGERLVDHIRSRNRLQHEYPELQAREIYAAARATLGDLPAFARGYARWLRELGYGADSAARG